MLCRIPFYLRDGACKIAFLRAYLSEGPPADLAVIEFLQYPHEAIRCDSTARRWLVTNDAIYTSVTVVERNSATPRYRLKMVVLWGGGQWFEVMNKRSSYSIKRTSGWRIDGMGLCELSISRAFIRRHATDQH